MPSLRPHRPLTALRRAGTALLASVAVLLVVGVSGAVAVGPGQVVSGFGGGVVLAPGGVRSSGVGVGSDGSVFGAGSDGSQARLVRYSPQGQVVFSVPAAGLIDRGGALLGEGMVVRAGGDATGDPGIRVQRFSADGSVDSSFGSGGVVSVLAGSRGQGNAVAIEPGGEIVVAGEATIPAGNDQGYPGFALVRISPSGHVDSSQIFDFGRFSIANSVAIGSDGKIVLAGSLRGDLQTTEVIAARFSANGTPDPSFGSGGVFVNYYSSGAAYSEANAVTIQPDGKIVLAGTVLDSTGADTLIIRLSTTGAQDPTFHSQGFLKLPASASATAYAQQPPYPGALAVTNHGGKIIAAGYYDNYLTPQLAIWAINPNGSADTTFTPTGLLLGPTGTQANAITANPANTLTLTGQSTTTALAAQYGAPTAILTPPSPTPTPPTPKPPSPGGGGKNLTVKLSLGPRFKISSLLGSGLPLTLSCDESCRARATLTIAYSVAKRLRLTTHKTPRHSFTIATLSAKLTRANHAYHLHLKLSRAAHRALGRLRGQISFGATLVVRVSSGGQTKSSSRQLTLHLP
jgi:uncharacterized delta-60 repeat protein